MKWLLCERPRCTPLCHGQRLLRRRARQMKSSKLRITLRRSPIGYEKSQGLTLRALGLRHLHQTVEKADTPAIRGMINKVVHLVTVETVNNKEGATGK